MGPWLMFPCATYSLALVLQTSQRSKLSASKLEW